MECGFTEFAIWHTQAVVQEGDGRLAEEFREAEVRAIRTPGTVTLPSSLKAK